MKNGNQDVKLLPVSVAARRLGCSPSNIYRLIATGELVAIRTGASKGYKVPGSEIEAFTERRRIEREARY